MMPAAVRWKRFDAEVLFLNPNDAARGIAALIDAGCEFEYNPNPIDDYGPTIFGTVTGTTELDEKELSDWLMGIIARFSGDVVECGLDEPGNVAMPENGTKH